MSLTESSMEVEHDRSGATVVLHRVDQATPMVRPSRPRAAAEQGAGRWAWAVPGALIAVAALALSVRLWRLDAVGFNSDEAVYAGQAASLAGNPNYSELFPVFRAHPMLFQAVLSPFFRSGEVDVAGRVVVAVFGVATVLAVYLLGARLYSRPVGVVAALFLAVMPYHVIVTRQVLLDGPMVLFATLTLYCLVRFVQGQQLLWYVAAGGMLGATMLTKETSIVLAGGVYAFLALTPTVKRPVRISVLALAAMAVVFATHPISQALAGRSATGRSYLVWQLFRRPNHSMSFYLETVPGAMGLLLVAAAACGLWWLRRQRSWRETLLVSWVAAPVVFFQLWPVKGFQYLLPVAGPVAVLAARALVGLPLPARLRRYRLPWAGRLENAEPFHVARSVRALRIAAIAAVTLSLLVPSWKAVNQADNATFLAGSGGVPGGREAGRWLAANTPEGSVVLTLGPSMANIMQYYGHRRSYGLSVSPNPLHRNPSYDPLPNPDWWLRHNDLQYVVWDSFSAQRSKFFAERLMVLVRRYHGRVVHTEYVERTSSSGTRVPVPVIIIYEVRP
ncbi:glycosyltransferase family 39 protein [Micromonospora sp. NPDC050200]|uniref:ArnT family glycosyltransferase n=1 Tax=Micromonospora sp. NPDC050200 TaxID=3155664 RepID=UPI0033EB0BBC